MFGRSRRARIKARKIGGTTEFFDEHYAPTGLGNLRSNEPLLVTVNRVRGSCAISLNATQRRVVENEGHVTRNRDQNRESIRDTSFFAALQGTYVVRSCVVADVVEQ